MAAYPASNQKENNAVSNKERERLLFYWLINPDALVDFCPEETLGGIVIVNLSEENGSVIEEFRFDSIEGAEGAIDYALEEIAP